MRGSACRQLLPMVVAALWGAGSCAPVPPKVSEPPAAPVIAPPAGNLLDETVAPEGGIRAHRLARCLESEPVPAVVEGYLGTCSEYFRDGSGSDGMIEMELGLAAGHRHPLMLVVLGQLYLLAGQGDPDLLPVEGPAADAGSYAANKPRLLGRARALLEEAAGGLPDDAAVDYLLADVSRALGEDATADELAARGQAKCTGGRTFQMLQLYQDLDPHAPRYLGGPPPAFPALPAAKQVGGDVVLDLLISPAAEVRQYSVVQSPTDALSGAAWSSLREGRYEAARVGKYPVWSWLRVTTAFRLEP